MTHVREGHHLSRFSVKLLLSTLIAAITIVTSGAQAEARVLEYDGAGRLASSVDDSSTKAYLYDGRGDMVAIVENGVRTEIVNHDGASGAQGVARMNPQSSVLVAPSPEGNVFATSTSAGYESRYSLPDVLGTTRGVVGSAGEILERVWTDAHGASRGPKPPLVSPASAAGFTGEPALGDDLVYLRARTYLASAGVMLQRDTLNVPNRYSYVDGQVTTARDPSGHLRQHPGSSPASVAPVGTRAAGARSGPSRGAARASLDRPISGVPGMSPEQALACEMDMRCMEKLMVRANELQQSRRAQVLGPDLQSAADRILETMNEDEQEEFASAILIVPIHEVRGSRQELERSALALQARYGMNLPIYNDFHELPSDLYALFIVGHGSSGQLSYDFEDLFANGLAQKLSGVHPRLVALYSCRSASRHDSGRNLARDLVHFLQQQGKQSVVVGFDAAITLDWGYFDLPFGNPLQGLPQRMTSSTSSAKRNPGTRVYPNPGDPAQPQVYGRR